MAHRLRNTRTGIHVSGMGRWRRTKTGSHFSGGLACSLLSAFLVAVFFDLAGLFFAAFGLPLLLEVLRDDLRLLRCGDLLGGAIV